MTRHVARLRPHNGRRDMLLAQAGLIAAVFSVMPLVACTGQDSSRASSQDARAPLEVTPTIDPVGLAALVNSVFAAGMKRERIPGAAFVLVQKGRVALSNGFGLADVASGRAVRPDRTIFPFASTSKVFTATAVMQLAERGRIDLDTDVNQYLRTVRVPPTYPQSGQLWDTRWVEVSPLYFVSLDGRRRVGFAEGESGRIVAVTAGAWRVLERIQ